MYVCICNAVTDRDIREAVQQGALSLKALREQLQVATCCGRCAGCARRCLHQALADPQQQALA
ncbi:MAG: (2Fe-2S)-binding protein [Gammaproteobacteria bacterium]|nr:(2Fe-2S)-binding protein [Gammaproteobacteria bacterium]